MKKIKNLFIGLVFAVLVAGCGGSGGGSGGDGGSSTLTIANDYDSYDPIYYVYISYAGDAWGNDKLGSSTINPGDSVSWTIHDCDDYFDIKVVYSDGTTRYSYDEYLECGYTTTFTYIDY